MSFRPSNFLQIAFDRFEIAVAAVPVGSGIIPEKSLAKSDASPVTTIQLPIITAGCARSPSQSLGEDAYAETA